MILQHFVDRTAPAPTLDQIAAATGIDLAQASGASRVARQVAINPTGEGIGRHLLPDGKQFLGCLEREVLDLLVMDNFMETAAFLWQAEIEDGTRQEFFTSARMTDRPRASRGQILRPLQSALNLRRVIDFIRPRRPGCRIVFVTFPFNTYGDTGPRRIWADEFGRHFSPGDAHPVPPLTVPKRLWTEEPSRYKPEMYFAHAGLVRSFPGFRA
jgi:hypothetical protein